MPDDPHPQLEKALHSLSEARREAVSLQDALDLIRRLRQDVKAVTAQWVAVSCRLKDIDPGGATAAEEWLGGPFCILRNLRFLERSIDDIARRGRPHPPQAPRRRKDGTWSVDVFPAHYSDRLLYRGFRGTIRFLPEWDLSRIEKGQAREWQETRSRLRLCLVLSGGNVSSIGPMDVLHKVFIARRSVILKLHPVNAALGPLIERAFAVLIEKGLLRVVSGGAAEGEFLCRHPQVDEIHITGSDKTHDAIVYGAGEEGARRKAQDRPLLEKPISSELGNVSPVILVPGDWRRKDVQFHARNLASMLANNAGFNCNAARVLITHRDWPQRDEFLVALRGILKTLPTRQAYYPGADERYRRHIESQSHVERFGTPRSGELPWTLITDLPHQDRSNPNFVEESFCSLLVETSLPASSVEGFLEKAVDFANQTLWGTLNAALLAPPSTLSDRSVGAAFEKAIDRLRYGTVCVNHWPALGFGLAVTPWGAYPGHVRQDIQSGTGSVHNTFMYPGIEKTVLQGPFRVVPKPVWFVDHSRPLELARRLVDFEADASLLRLPGIIAAALSG